jgi:hypothetical protein
LVDKGGWINYITEEWRKLLRTTRNRRNLDIAMELMNECNHPTSDELIIAC